MRSGLNKPLASLRSPLGTDAGVSLIITAPAAYYYLTSASPYDIGSTLTVGDSDDVGGTYTLAITLTGGGTLTLSGTTGLTGSGSGTSSLSYSGTLTNLNAALDGADIAGLSDEAATMAITLTRDADSVERSRNVTVNAYPALAVSTFDPADDATGVAYDRATYTATFNRGIQAGAGNVVLKLVGGATIETFDIAAGTGDQGGTVAIDGSDLVISPNVTLTDDTAHAIQIASTAIDGSDIGTGDSFAGIANDTTWSFTCEDTTPTLSSPLDSATGGTTATAAVTTDRGDGTLYWVVTTSATTPSHAQIVAGDDHADTDATASGSQAVTGTGSQAVSVTGLTSETQYYIHFTQVSANSAEATPVSADGFTTDDVTAPTISALDPADDSTDHPVADPLAATFSENIAFGTGDIRLVETGVGTVETFSVSTETGDNGGTVSISTDTLTITPGDDLTDSTAYHVEIDATAIEDASGNAFAGIGDATTWSFEASATVDAYAVGGNSPEFVADFAGAQNSGTELYRVSGGTSNFASALSFSRTSVAEYINASGVPTEVSSGAARTQHYVSNGITFINEGLLFEPASKENVLTYSKDFSQSVWTKTNVASLTTPDAEGPDGTTDAFTLTDDNGGDTVAVRLQRSLTLGSGGDWVIRVVAKKGSVNWLIIGELLYDGETNYNYFNIDGGVTGLTQSVADGGAAYIRPLANGFFECCLRMSTTTDLAGVITVQLTTADNTPTVLTNGTKSIILHSIEMGKETVPTSGVMRVSAAATRAAETLSIPAANTAPATSAISMFGEFLVSREAGSSTTILNWEADANNKVSIGVNASNQAFMTSIVGGVSNTVTGAEVISADTERGLDVPLKIAARLSSSEINISVNGVLETAVSVSGLPDLSGADIDFLAQMTIREFRLWDDVDIGDSAIETLSQADIFAFLLAGQSNMIGRATWDYGVPSPRRTYQLDSSDNLVPVTIPLDHPDAAPSDMGLSITFARDLVTANPRAIVVFVPCAAGSSSFTGNNWNEDDAEYNYAVAQANTAISLLGIGALSGALWHQGESDAFSSMSEAAYEAALDAMITAMRTDITGGTDLKFVVGELGTFLDGGTYPTASAINSAIADTPNRLSNVALASSASLTDDDGVHFDADSLRTFGSRYYAAWAGL